MEISTLVEFCELVHSGSYSKAAVRLSLTQPVLSRHIQRLEQELGYPLLKRTTRHIELNEAGTLFLPYASRIADLYQEYLRTVRSGSASNRLRIGMPELFSPSSILDQIYRFTTPRNISVDIVQETFEDLLVSLSQQRLDLAVSYEQEGAETDGMDRLPYFTDELAAVLPAGHPLSREAVIPLEALANENFIFFRKDNLIGRLSHACCAQAGFEPRVIHYSKFEDNILEMIRKGAGCSLLLMNPATVTGAAVVPIRPTIRVSLNLIYPKNHPSNTELLEYIRAHRPISGR